VAKSQLETAISLWFEDADPISILMLAFNAHELLHALGKQIHKPSQLQVWLDTMPESFRMRFRYVWNFCKHGFKDLEDDTPHDPRHADVLIFFSSLCYRDVFGKRTPLMFAFDARHSFEFPNLLSWEAAVRMPEFFELYDIVISTSRPEFLKDFLKLVEMGKLTLPPC
jgi:hypothetical protein